MSEQPLSLDQLLKSIRELLTQSRQQIVQTLSVSLKEEFGKGFDLRNLRNMRSFYLAFPIRNAVRTELTWTHYRTFIRRSYSLY